ncbi:globin [Ceratina calcarata]|uniref:Globin n=1 Tax=Ceratina calcarata TaxID=156304 RepID=A0AAJ7S199_9HYME|nr:globin [Ceratina calcarata]XP_026669092.1 globin [Ceratina calcarata]
MMGTFMRLLGLGPGEDRVDPATGLTERQKKLVQNTWAVIRKDEARSGVAVMTAFFGKYPDYQKNFPAFADTPLDELAGNKRFQAHCMSIVAALNDVIDSLHDPGLMEATLIGLAERHKKRGQTTEQFQNLKEILLNVLSQGLGRQYTQEVAEAWDKTLEAAFTKIYEILEH